MGPPFLLRHADSSASIITHYCSTVFGPALFTEVPRRSVLGRYRARSCIKGLSKSDALGERGAST